MRLSVNSNVHNLFVFFVLFSNQEMASGLGLAFCGDSVCVSSALLHADVSQPADIEKCLLRLSSAGTPPSGKSVGLMFACMGRGKHFYNGSVGVESAVFKRLYPNVPLLGFFGGGEIGYNFPLDKDKKHSTAGVVPAGVGDGDGDGVDEDDTVMPAMYHSYTTIFVLLSFLS